MQLLGCDIVFPCRNNVLLLCRDNVATKTVTARGQVLQPLCYNRFFLDKGFYVVTEHFYVVTKFCQGEEILCHDREFDVTIELPEIVSRRSISCVAIESSRTWGLPCHDIDVCTTKALYSNSHCVASQQTSYNGKKIK